MPERLKDEDILLLCEDLMNVLHARKMSGGDGRSAVRRFDFIAERIETERRLIEEISRPGRLMIEHFSFFLEKMDYTIGLAYGDVQTGRGLLSGIRVGEWGTITLDIGDVSVTWRDADVGYMFYPDRITVRPKDSGQDDMTFFFSYSFKYNVEQLKDFQDVSTHEQTLYWHNSLTLE